MTVKSAYLQMHVVQSALCKCRSLNQVFFFPLPVSVLFNTTVIQSQVRVTGLPVGTRMTLCVTALVNDTVEGDAVTTVNYTGESGLMVSS